MNLYPPYIGAGIRLKNVNTTATRYEVVLKARPWNRNLYGTHFGGSLYSMCDPWYVFSAAAYFGEGYTMWDKSASIKYLKPGRGTLTGVFEIPLDRLAEMKKEVDRVGKMTYTFTTYLYDRNDVKVTMIEKEIYIRKGK